MVLWKFFLSPLHRHNLNSVVRLCVFLAENAFMALIILLFVLNMIIIDPLNYLL
jgi:hypothetical protein